MHSSLTEVGKVQLPTFLEWRSIDGNIFFGMTGPTLPLIVYLYEDSRANQISKISEYQTIRGREGEVVALQKKKKKGNKN